MARLCAGIAGKLAGLDTAKLPAVDGKARVSAAPVTGISKFVAIGLNYVDHLPRKPQSDSS